jgi:hypothetical protein
MVIIALTLNPSPIGEGLDYVVFRQAITPDNVSTNPFPSPKGQGVRAEVATN